jgi:hypothetical protein
VIEIAGRVDESSHLLRAEHGRQSLVGFRKWNVLSQKVPAQCLYEQEAQRGHILTDRGRSQLLRLEQMSLILPNLLGPELEGRLVGLRTREIFTSDHYRGFPAVLVYLDCADEWKIRSLLTGAWRCQAPLALRRQQETNS